jgi:hypothetical protein
MVRKVGDLLHTGDRRRFPTSRRPHTPVMPTKRFEDIDDCWRHSARCIVECLAWRHWERFSMLTGPEPARSNLPNDAAVRRFRCDACGSRRLSLFPGKEPHKWQGHRYCKSIRIDLAMQLPFRPSDSDPNALADENSITTSSEPVPRSAA